jgi:hypothetical protein
MYPEELAKLRADHPGIQYDGHGRVIGATPFDSVQQAANAVYQLPGMQPNAWDFGPTRSDFQNSKDFVGPMPQQWWDPSGDLMQLGQQGQQDWLGGFMQGRDLQPRRVSRPSNPYAGQPSQAQQASNFDGQMVPPEVRGMRQRALHAGVDDLIADAKGNNWGVNPLYPYTYAYRGYGASYPYDHDDGSGEFTPGV